MQRSALFGQLYGVNVAQLLKVNVTQQLREYGEYLEILRSQNIKNWTTWVTFLGHVYYYHSTVIL